jgi:hypothetical protein
MTEIPGTITVAVPFALRRHGGRKQVMIPVHIGCLMIDER